MFDVIWTDPDRELVGEHRAKKDRNKDKKKSTSKDRSQRNSISTRSSLSSGDSPFAFLKPKGLRQARSSKGTPSLESIAVTDSATSSNRSIKSPSSLGFDFRKNRRTSALSVVGAASFLDSSRPSQDQSVRSQVASTAGELSPSLTSSESIFSHSQESDGRTSNSILERASDDLPKHEGLPGGQEITPLLNAPAETGDGLVSNIGAEMGNPNLAHVASNPQKLLTPPRTPEEGSGPSAAQQENAIRKQSDCPTPPPKSPLRRSSKRYSALFHRNNGNEGALTAGSSTTMNVRDIAGATGASIDSMSMVVTESMAQSAPNHDPEELQKKVARMTAASSLEALQQLKDVLQTNMVPPGSTTINIEQHHWMLSVLNHLNGGSADVPGPQDQLVLYDAPGNVVPTLQDTHRLTYRRKTPRRIGLHFVLIERRTISAKTRPPATQAPMSIVGVFLMFLLLRSRLCRSNLTRPLPFAFRLLSYRPR
jgi:hypothetical protein